MSVSVCLCDCQCLSVHSSVRPATSQHPLSHLSLCTVFIIQKTRHKFVNIISHRRKSKGQEGQYTTIPLAEAVTTKAGLSLFYYKVGRPIVIGYMKTMCDNRKGIAVSFLIISAELCRKSRIFCSFPLVIMEGANIFTIEEHRSVCIRIKHSMKTDILLAF